MQQDGCAEACDDGNLENGDGCDATCQLEPCTAAPASGCRVATQPARAAFQVQDKSPDKRDTLRWTWTAEPAVMNMAVRTGDADIVNPLPPAFAGPLGRQRDVRVLDSQGSENPAPA